MRRVQALCLHAGLPLALLAVTVDGGRSSYDGARLWPRSFWQRQLSRTESSLVRAEVEEAHACAERLRLKEIGADPELRSSLAIAGDDLEHALRRAGGRCRESTEKRQGIERAFAGQELQARRDGGIGRPGS